MPLMGSMSSYHQKKLIETSNQDMFRCLLFWWPAHLHSRSTGTHPLRWRETRCSRYSKQRRLTPKISKTSKGIGLPNVDCSKLWMLYYLILLAYWIRLFLSMVHLWIVVHVLSHPIYTSKSQAGKLQKKWKETGRLSRWYYQRVIKCVSANQTCFWWQWWEVPIFY